MKMPVMKALRRTNSRPMMANTSVSASLCAPATTDQISSGLSSTNSTARVCRAASPAASRMITSPTTMNGITAIICSQNTTSCIDSPPSTLASHWDADAIGPYTLGVSCQGRSVQTRTGSNDCRKISAGVTLYGSMPWRWRRPYAAYMRTSALVSGSVNAVARLSPTPRVISRRIRGRQPATTARCAITSPNAPTMMPTHSTGTTTHSDSGSPMALPHSTGMNHGGSRLPAAGPTLSATVEGPRNAMRMVRTQLTTIRLSPRRPLLVHD